MRLTYTIGHGTLAALQTKAAQLEASLKGMQMATDTPEVKALWTVANDLARALEGIEYPTGVEPEAATEKRIGELRGELRKQDYRYDANEGNGTHMVVHKAATFDEYFRLTEPQPSAAPGQ